MGELPDEGEIIQFWSNGRWLWEIAERAAEQYVELAADGLKVASCGRRIGCLEASSRSCTRGVGSSKLKIPKPKPCDGVRSSKELVNVFGTWARKGKERHT